MPDTLPVEVYCQKDQNGAPAGSGIEAEDKNASRESWSLNGQAAGVFRWGRVAMASCESEIQGWHLSKDDRHLDL